MGAKCNISAAQKASSDKATVNALDGNLKSGIGSKLSQMSSYATHQMQDVGAAPAQKVTVPPPPHIQKKHDLINYFLGQGLKGQAVVDAMSAQGFKIKAADVAANIKHYGTDKIPANFPKTDLAAVEAAAKAAAAQAQAALDAPTVETITQTTSADEAFNKQFDEFVNDKYNASPTKPSVGLKPAAEFTNLTEFEKHFGITTTDPEQFMQKAQLLGYSAKDAEAMVKVFSGEVKTQTLEQKVVGLYHDSSVELSHLDPASIVYDAKVQFGATPEEVFKLLKKAGVADNQAVALMYDEYPEFDPVAQGLVADVQTVAHNIEDFGSFSSQPYPIKPPLPAYKGGNVNAYFNMQLVSGYESDAIQASIDAWKSGATASTPSKLQVVKSYKDTKHDLIYKLRMAGYKGQEVVDQMAHYGYKIKLTDVNANIKHYGTPKIPMSPHVAGQVAQPQVSMSGAVKPAIGTASAAPVKTVSVAEMGQAGDVPYARADTVMVKKIGEAAGSNPGGLYEDGNGTKWYVKQYPKAAQAPNEWVTNELYNALGVAAPESKVLQLADGSLAIATKYIEGTETLAKAGLTKQRAENILDGFVADVLTANWDAVGLELDNVVFGADGVAIRVDQGGALLFRAKGGLKDVGALKNNLTEWDSFLNGSTNPAYAKVTQAAGVSSAADIKTIVTQLDNLEKAWAKYGNDWYKFFAARPELPDALAKEFGNILNARTNKLLLKRAEIIKSQKAAEELKAFLAKPFNADQLVYKEITGSVNIKATLAAAKSQPGILVIGNSSYDLASSTKLKLVTHAPVAVANAGAEATARWYLKYHPDLDPNEIAQVLSLLKKDATLKGEVPFDIRDRITLWTHEAMGITKDVAPMQAGYATEKTATAKLDKSSYPEAVLTEEERKAVRRYTGSSSGLNNDLRNNTDGEVNSPGNRKWRDEMDKAMRKAQLNDNVVMWRGVGGDDFLHKMSVQELQRLVGTRIADRGYASTSTLQSKAQGFSAGRVLIRYHMPKGTRAVWVGNHTGLTSHMEHEAILARGSELLVTKITFDGRYYIVDVEIAAQPF